MMAFMCQPPLQKAGADLVVVGDQDGRAANHTALTAK
jgi:hypothetical protein